MVSVAPTASTMRLIEYADEHCTLVGGSPGYREQLRVLCRRLPWHVADLDPERINAYLQEALKHLAASTVNNHRRMLTTLYRRAVNDGLAKESTRRICVVKYFFPPVRAWTLEELGRLVAAAEKMRGGTQKNPCKYSVLLPAYVRVGYSSGLRRGDLLSLRWDSVRGDRLTLVLGKTRSSHVCVIDSQAVESMRLLPRYDQLVFGSIISKDQIKKVLRRLIDSCGLVGSGKYLRRSSATYAELNGLSAMYQLGHQTPGIAYRHYVDQVILSENRSPVPPIPLAAVG